MGKGNFSPFCTESRPPTFCSSTNDSITDVGVRLKVMRTYFALISRTPTAQAHCSCNLHQVGGRHPGSRILLVKVALPLPILPQMIYI